jgi:hypothetical protein
MRAAFSLNTHAFLGRELLESSKQNSANHRIFEGAVCLPVPANEPPYDPDQEG